MNNWLSRLKKKAILPAMAFLTAAATIGTTFAWQQWDLSIKNNLKAHDVAVQIEEKFKPEEGHKQVTFKNTGDSSVFLRVSYAEYWINQETGVYGLHDDPNWNYGEIPTNILSNTVNGIEIAKKAWVSEWPDSGSGDTSIWFDAKDGWYYYKKVLHTDDPGVKILDGVGFLKKLPDDTKVPAEYTEGNYRLFFKAEVVQCSDGSNTLNSSTVNANSTAALFGRKATVAEDGVTVIWEGEAEWNDSLTKK